jgi:hypothetical protein
MKDRLSTGSGKAADFLVAHFVDQLAIRTDETGGST